MTQNDAPTIIRDMYEDALAGRTEQAFGAIADDFVLQEPPVLPA